MTARTTTFLTTADLGLSAEVTGELADWMDVTYGDATYTLVCAKVTRAALLDMDWPTCREAAAHIEASNAQYVAFPG